MSLLIEEFKNLHGISYYSIAKACDIAESTIFRRRKLGWRIRYIEDEKKLIWVSGHNGAEITQTNIELNIND